ncbi:MAG: hypothetical protein M1549_01610 [Candidatus Dependentiae bacterium]|nr:hypothetical protein [Candidatus Dependentiae bacterium]
MKKRVWLGLLLSPLLGSGWLWAQTTPSITSASLGCCGVQALPAGTSPTANACSCCAHGTMLIPRSLGDRLDWQNHYFSYKFDEDCIYGTFNVNYEYMPSFRGERMAQYLFGSNKLHFTGSQVENRAATDLLADNFGMATDTNAWISFCPKIKNQIVDFQLYVGLNELCDGLYFQINLPLVHTKWELNDNCRCCNSVCDTCCGASTCQTLSTTPFPSGYMSSQSTSANAMPPTVTPNTTFLAALSGTKVGDMAQDWGYGRFFGCNCAETKLSGFYLEIGYNFFECEDYHVGFYGRMVAPTGTEMDEDHARCVFKPTIGDDHWKLGGGLEAHARLYSCDDEAHTLDMYLEGYALHMLERSQVRSFDFLAAGRMSRYMLLKEFDSNNLYTGNLYNAIDYTTRRARVTVAVQGEGVIGFLYKNECGLALGIGYNFYGKSHEKIDGLCDKCNTTIASKNLGIKGNTPLQAQFYSGDSATTDPITPIAKTYKLNSTESAATAFATAPVDNDESIGWVLGTAPSSKLAVVDGYNNNLTQSPLPDVGSTIAAVTSSSTTIESIDPTTYAITTDTPAPLLVNSCMLNLYSGAVPGQATHRIYGHIDYEWSDCDWSPMLRLGGEVELASQDARGAVNMWGILLWGGLSF